MLLSLSFYFILFSILVFIFVFSSLFFIPCFLFFHFNFNFFYLFYISIYIFYFYFLSFTLFFYFYLYLYLRYFSCFIQSFGGDSHQKEISNNSNCHESYYVLIVLFNRFGIFVLFYWELKMSSARCRPGIRVEQKCFFLYLILFSKFTIYLKLLSPIIYHIILRMKVL